MQPRGQATRVLANAPSSHKKVVQPCALKPSLVAATCAGNLQVGPKTSVSTAPPLQQLHPHAVGECRSPPPKRAPRRNSQQDAGGLGLLERLLASSPRPPKWARSMRTSFEGDLVASSPRKTDTTEQATGAQDLGEGDGTDGLTLGKWARNSKVGAQVRSASDLRAISEEPSNAQKTSMLSLSTSISAGQLDRGVGGMMWKPPPADDSDTSRCTEYAATAGRSLQPLPPKPSFPPPSAAVVPLLKGLGTTKSVTDTEVKEDALQMSASSSSATLDLLTSTLTEDSIFQIGLSRIEGISEGAPTPASPMTSAHRLHEQVRQLRADVLRIIPTGPESEEVALLLHRLEALLQLRSQPLEEPRAKALA
mmetsp:Transcript_50134/g.119334  ORF Transcript_50134/g.119334 Transcript_50134/m.119334 type:complete len:365 (+) Transcript_50134:94-1188(+)|eukprot:CAMPEP_0178415270 /NCGR_PEP_ID=MMETSP0689_2-20121128/23466_1 /TAXON_ID=160604 /ORGANISM="Amphidinium massartii, Strain CS-259" /LENGTH=364 /DNA_ID=CAMNT_0020036587 /DNA_START=81 /DNA_END=1175 /DNA_ORIENTATION=+